MPPVMPAAKLSPTGPRITAVPPVMYSQPLHPQPSTTTLAPELRTAKRSPACPAAKSLPAVGEELPGIADHLGIQGLGHFVAALQRAIAGIFAGIGLGQDRVEIEIIEIGGTPVHLGQQIGAPDHLVERAGAQAGQDLAYL